MLRDVKIFFHPARETKIFQARRILYFVKDATLPVKTVSFLFKKKKNATKSSIPSTKQCEHFPARFTPSARCAAPGRLHQRSPNGSRGSSRPRPGASLRGAPASRGFLPRAPPAEPRGRTRVRQPRATRPRARGGPASPRAARPRALAPRLPGGPGADAGPAGAGRGRRGRARRGPRACTMRPRRREPRASAATLRGLPPRPRPAARPAAPRPAPPRPPPLTVAELEQRGRVVQAAVAREAVLHAEAAGPRPLPRPGRAAAAHPPH